LGRLTAVLALLWAVASSGTAAPQAPVRRVVVVIDGSLSMIVRDALPAPDGTPAGPTRFEASLDDVLAALDHLAGKPGQWEFRLVCFGPAGAGPDGLWTFPRDPARFAQESELAAAEAAVAALREGGPAGTSRLGPALQHALQLRPGRVLLYTDGMPLSAPAGNVPDTQVAILDGLSSWNAPPPAIPIDVVGVGAGVARAHDFLRTLARESGGYFVATD
jgi:hypothetical protein